MEPEGGLTSPYLFNLFYQDLIVLLHSKQCGVTIQKYNYNVICYADDILLCSTTSKGLQDLINMSVDFVHKFGLSLNPDKSECMIFGKNPYTKLPHWEINGTELNVSKNIKYLGTVLSSVSGNLMWRAILQLHKRHFIHSKEGASCLIVCILKQLLIYIARQ